MTADMRFALTRLLLTVSAIALLLSLGLGFWFMLLVTQIIAISVCVEVMTQRMPPKLLNASRDNCRRMDGTLSGRRSAREQRALRKVRSDLWAIFLTAALVGSGLLVAIDTCLFPLKLTGDVAAAFQDSPNDFKTALRNRSVDEKFFRWSRSSHRSTNSQIRQQTENLWGAAPIMAGLAAAGVVACLALIRFSYLRTLREFQSGVSARTSEYLNLDLGRLER